MTGVGLSVERREVGVLSRAGKYKFNNALQYVADVYSNGEVIISFPSGNDSYIFVHGSNLNQAQGNLAHRIEEFLMEHDSGGAQSRYPMRPSSKIKKDFVPFPTRLARLRSLCDVVK